MHKEHYKQPRPELSTPPGSAPPAPATGPAPRLRPAPRTAPSPPSAHNSIRPTGLSRSRSSTFKVTSIHDRGQAAHPPQSQPNRTESFINPGLFCTQRPRRTPSTRAYPRCRSVSLPLGAPWPQQKCVRARARFAFSKRYFLKSPRALMSCSISRGTWRRLSFLRSTRLRRRVSCLICRNSSYACQASCSTSP